MAPEKDDYHIFGFSWNIEASLLKKEMFTILGQIYNLDKGRESTDPKSSEDNQNTSIEMNSLKSSLRSGNSYSGGNINKMISNE
jgi:hypothetical protein